MDSTHREYGGWNIRRGLETAVLSAWQGRGLAQEQRLFKRYLGFVSLDLGFVSNEQMRLFPCC
jgi:hypothetical protein